MHYRKGQQKQVIAEEDSDNFSMSRYQSIHAGEYTAKKEEDSGFQLIEKLDNNQDM